MASLEAIVRPVVLPDIRPPAPRTAAGTDPARGIATLSGSAQFVALSHSASMGWQTNHLVEVKRRFDVLRVKNPQDHEQYVDVEAITQLKQKTVLGESQVLRLAKPTATDDIEVIDEDRERDSNIPVN